MPTHGRVAAIAGTMLAALTLTLAAPPAPPAQATSRVSVATTTATGADPDTVLVRTHPGVSVAQLRGVLARHRGSVAAPVTKTGYVAVRASGRAAALRRSLAADPAVAAVEPNYLRTALTVPDDPGWKDGPRGRKSGQHKYLSLLRLPEAWDIARGSPSIDIAILDTGVDLDTPDLAGRVAPGYNVLTGGRTPPRDDHGHGTMVAGAAAAISGNGRGIAGAAWTARVIPVKVLDANGWGGDANIIAGIQWAVDHGAEIINLSLGNAAPSAALHAAVRYARARGVLVTAAAGNSGVEQPTYPAAYPEVLAVAATDDKGRLAKFSTRGTWVDVAAPGNKIMSTVLADGRPNEEAYAVQSGTSFAAPLVAGVAALIRARYPAWGPDQIAIRLRATARRADRSAAWSGIGIVDAAAALGGAPGEPLRAAG